MASTDDSAIDEEMQEPKTTNAIVEPPEVKFHYCLRC